MQSFEILVGSNAQMPRPGCAPALFDTVVKSLNLNCVMLSATVRMN